MFGLTSMSTISAGKLLPALALFQSGVKPLVHLDSLDIAVIAIYFAMVLLIGFYLKQKSNTSEDFFMAGREMTAWIAGLSFISANLGALELMGWAGATYEYGILAAHWYWIGAIPAILFLGMVMMPFYIISKIHSVPEYLNLRFGRGASVVAAVSFAFMTVLMSGVNMFAMALVMKVVLGWSMTFSIVVSSLAVATYVTLGGLRSAIFNEVLQFMLIWIGALLVPIFGLIEVGGWDALKIRIVHNIVNGPSYLHTSLTTLWEFSGQELSLVWDSRSVADIGAQTSWWCSVSFPPTACVQHEWRRLSARSSRWQFRSS
jgi:SSS family solute:Na+ symporter